MVEAVVIAALVVFAAGLAVGAVVLISWGIQREERTNSLTQQPPGLLSAGTRRFTGLYVRRRTDAGPVVSRGTGTYV